MTVDRFDVTVDGSSRYWSSGSYIKVYAVLNVRMKYAGGVAVYFNGDKVARFNLAESFGENMESMTVHSVRLHGPRELDRQVHLSQHHAMVPGRGREAPSRADAGRQNGRDQRHSDGRDFPSFLRCACGESIELSVCGDSDFGPEGSLQHAGSVPDDRRWGGCGVSLRR